MAGAFMRWLLIVLLAAGCAHVTDKDRAYLSALNAWVGKDINLAFEMMGPPTDVFRMPNGRTQYTWLVSGPETTVHGSYFSRDRTKRCKTIFTATPDGVVDAIKSEGRCGTGRT